MSGWLLLERLGWRGLGLGLVRGACGARTCSHVWEQEPRARPLEPMRLRKAAPVRLSVHTIRSGSGPPPPQAGVRRARQCGGQV